MKSQILDVEERLAEIGGELQRPVSNLPIEEQCKLLLQMRDLKDMIENFTKFLNKSITEANKQICINLAKMDTDYYETNEATFSGDAKGYFSVKDAEKLFFFLKEDKAKFIELTTKKRSLQTFCKEILEDGQDLPEDIFSNYLVPSVTVRRNT